MRDGLSDARPPHHGQAVATVATSSAATNSHRLRLAQHICQVGIRRADMVNTRWHRRHGTDAVLLCSVSSAVATRSVTSLSAAIASR